ncbi:MAG: sulfatase-like hydrolase/transferase, partial [Microlunatus sp.]|nr:sulfatase-like hydrolase/transferase [Microlunatus sp.]
IIDIAFSGALARPFDLVLDWSLFPGGWALLAASLGLPLATTVVAAAGLLTAAVLVGVPWAVLRLGRILDGQRTGAVASLVVLGAAWLTCASAGVRAIPPYPVAADASTTKIVAEIGGVRAGLLDQERFATEVAVDRFRDVPADQLLASLRGTRVVVIFVESYGRVALDDPQISPEVIELLDTGTASLAAVGLRARSGYLTSPTAGGGSWLAHATLQSGLWIDNQQRYRNLMATDRLTLTRAFADAGWHTLAVMPGTTTAWPDGAFYGYQDIYDAAALGYAGPDFGWARVPDQYTLAQTDRLTSAVDGRPPSMAVVPLVSSHAPWTPVPAMVDRAQLGNGSSIAPAAGPAEPPEAILTRDRSRVRTDYRRSLVYSLDSVVSYLQRPRTDDLLVIMVGDHQPSPVVTGPDAGTEVPISIVSNNPDLLARTDGWGWTDGLRPSADAPVWPMDQVRDRVLTVFTPERHR